MGRKEREQWIYTSYKRLSIPFYVKMRKIDKFFDWKEARGLQFIENFTVVCNGIGTCNTLAQTLRHI
jgi:hypothetical protein